MQVSIPKKELDQLIETYGCSQEDAARAYLTAQDRSKEAYAEALEDILGPKKHTPERKVKCYTPKEIKTHLDKFVVGQEEYKKRACIAASYHFAMIQYLHEHPDSQVKRFRKKNTIISGPSGSGKTYCAEVLGDLLEVPTLIVDATDYTEAGYVGKSADDMIRELIDLAPGSNREEQAQFVAQHGGIIFIDEIDKKAKEGGLIGHDISREGFQRSVLKLLERKLVPIDNPYSPASQIQEAMERQQGKKGVKKEKMISTENILFILGGSFERNIDNLETLVKKRVEHRGDVREDGSLVVRGFDFDQKSLSDREKEKYKNYFKEAGPEDYIRFGLLPELVGRAPIRTFVNLLSKNDLVRIMKETEDSILDQYKLEFAMFDIDLEISDDAVAYVAEVAENKKTGARALVSVWETILTDFQYELPGSNFKKLKIDREVCDRPKDMLLKMLEKSPFVDYIENFKREYGIELLLDEEVENYIEAVAKQDNMEVSATIKRLLDGASALNYMNHGGTFKITTEILQDPKYFDRMFTNWHEEQMTQESA